MLMVATLLAVCCTGCDEDPGGILNASGATVHVDLVYEKNLVDSFDLKPGYIFTLNPHFPHRLVSSIISVSFRTEGRVLTFDKDYLLPSIFNPRQKSITGRWEFDGKELKPIPASKFAEARTAGKEIGIRDAR